MNFKINWKRAFKEDLYDKVIKELINMNYDAEWEVYANNERYFEYKYFDDLERGMYYFKGIEDYKTDDLIYLAKEILEKSGKPYSIIKWHKGELIFEGYENLRHGEYLKRKRELGI